MLRPAVLAGVSLCAHFNLLCMFLKRSILSMAPMVTLDMKDLRIDANMHYLRCFLPSEPEYTLQRS